MADGRDALRKWQEKRGFNQREMADVLGFHETYVCQILKGNRFPALANAVRIERVTGIPVESWLARRSTKAASHVSKTAVSPELTECKA